MHQSILVTGASRGIGEATAVHLAHKGFRVYAAARQIDKLNELSALGSGRIHPIALDVTDPASIDNAIERINADGNTLYGLVNNAGTSIIGPFEDLSLDDWRDQFEVNLFGLVAMTRAVLPQMREAGRGRIINIGSISGRIAAAFQSPYAASKHAVEGLSDSLRREVMPHGIKVSVIRPVFINTDMGKQQQDRLEEYSSTGPYADQVRTFKAWHAKGHPSAPSPSIVAEAVHNALTADRPYSRYTVPQSKLGLLALRNFMPSGVIDRMYERVTGLDRFRKR
ncbi:SDR family oxidoreductase [Hyphococcus lacteus]|uniref:SDR family oxidoreductase n=1 Tax=Hyphococcus lacteus TaxID=3143536 RepID=A0ABV3Z666_9PROT